MPFHDTDEAIEKTTGRTVGDILVVDGEPAFRALERTEVLRALAEQPGVVCVGSGAVADEQVQEALAGRTAVFLDVRVADAARRLGLDKPRTMLLVNPRSAWTEMMNGRRPVYERVSSLRVDTSGKEPQQVAAEIARALGY